MSIAKVLAEVLSPLLELLPQSWVERAKIRGLRRRYLKAMINMHASTQSRLPESIKHSLAPTMPPLHLEQVFVEPLVTFPRLNPGSQVTPTLDIEPDRWQKLYTYLTGKTPRLPRPGEVGEAILSHPRLVLCGPAGSGKSTILQYLALTCARASLGPYKRLLQERLGWVGRPPFPILVSLDKLVQEPGWKTDFATAMAQLVAHELSVCEQQVKEFLNQALAKRQCLVLLDGLDEIADTRLREEICQRLVTWANLSLPAPPDFKRKKSRRPKLENRVVVSSRTEGYNGELNQYDFTVCQIECFDKPRIDEFAKRRYGALSDHFSSDAAKSLQKHLELPHLQQLASNPLLLNLLFMLHILEQKLPSDRIMVYQEYVASLTRKEGTSSDKQDSVLQTLAWLSQTQLSQSGVALLPWPLAIHVISGLLQVTDEKAQEFLKSLCAKTGLLRRSSDIPPRVDFEHPTLRCFFAACAAIADAERFHQLLEHAACPEWSEVVSLYVERGGQDSAVIAGVLREDRQPHSHRHVKLAAQCARISSNRGSLLEPVKKRVEEALWEEVEHSQNIDSVTESLNDWAWFNSGEQVVESLMGLLKSRNEAARIAATRVAESYQKGEPIKLLSEALVNVLQYDPSLIVRRAAGQALACLGDRRISPLRPDMVEIPAGGFTLGYLQHETYCMSLPRFAIGKYPVTELEYAQFVQETGHRPPVHWRETFALERANHPVVNVDWYDARAFCQWLGAKTGLAYRLPTEVEWEKAARGSSGLGWPWGNDFKAGKCNGQELGFRGTTPVGMFPEGASPYGVMDMAGNVWEWCSTLWGAYMCPGRGYLALRTIFPAPYQSDDGREKIHVLGARLVRGGSYLSGMWETHSGYRRYARSTFEWNAQVVSAETPVSVFADKGFRIALTLI